MLTALQRMMNAPNSFTLLAIPFFVFAGQVMSSGGVSERIFRFADVLVGHWRGGLAYANVIASLIFAGKSGSALADIGALGPIQVKAMREGGYKDYIILGVSGASATVAPITPPSIPFVIFGAMANVSIGGLFMAGIVPGLLIVVILCIFVFFVAKKERYPTRKRATLREIARACLDAFWALLFPIIIIGGIWTGLFTPTEAALVAAVYGLIIAIVIYKDFTIKEIPRLIKETVLMVGPALSAVVGAALFAWILTYEKVDQVLVKAIFDISTNKFVVLQLVNLILLFIGMFLEVIAAVMIMLPILMPIAETIGLHPIHLGVIVVLNLMIGLMTPPVGFSLFMLSSISGVSFGKTVKYCLPWTVPLIIVLLLVTYIEPLAMFLPRILGMGG
jgi:tripartite ATP-independent transporter DctM subunit